MSKKLYFLIIFAVLFNPLTAKASDYSELVVFGDSLSDTGNLAFLGAFDEYPHYKKRLSDGPLIVDRIAESLKLSSKSSEHLMRKNLGYNFAVSGGSIIGEGAGKLELQINAYLNKENQKADPDALYFLMIGGNDIIGLSAGITDQTAANEYIKNVVSTFRTQLNRLVSSGARSFLITNVPNIGSLPTAYALKGFDENIVDRATAYTQAYNDLLYDELMKHKDRKDISFGLYDFYSDFEYLRNNYQEFGFRSSTSACLEGFYLIIKPECAEYGFDSSVFFDGIHLTAKASSLIVSQLLKKLPAKPQ